MSALPTYHNESSTSDFFYTMHETTLSEILKRLQLKDLLRCRCVRKSWNSFIKSPNFIKFHFNYRKKHITTPRDGEGDDGDDDPKYLMFRWFICHGPMYLRYDDEQCPEFNKFELPTGILQHRVCWLATSCGLICVATDRIVAWSRLETTFYLWNPLIKKCRTLPALDLSHVYQNWSASAFGYVPWINDYQVVWIVSYFSRDTLECSTLFGVYSLNSNSWKTKHSKAYNDIDVRVGAGYESVFVNGFSCWRVGNDQDDFCVLYFDSMNEILGTIPIPQVNPDTDNELCLHQFGQSVALFVELPELNAINMWILKQDSIKNEFFWENKVSVTLQKPVHAKVVGVRNNGELVLASKSEIVHGLVSYDHENNQVKGFVESWKHWSTRGNETLSTELPHFLLYPFVGNLVLLDAD